MATESVATDTRAFWGFSGKYQLAPETTAKQALSDAGCLLEAARATLVVIIDCLEGEGGNIAADTNRVAQVLYGTMYQLDQVNNLLLAAQLKDA